MIFKSLFQSKEFYDSMLHCTNMLLFPCTIFLCSVAVMSPWVSAANGMGELIQTFWFGFGSGFGLFSNKNLTENCFASNQFPEQVQTNTLQTKVFATERDTRTRVLYVAASSYFLYQVTPSKSQEERLSWSLALWRKFIPFRYIGFISIQYN